MTHNVLQVSGDSFMNEAGWFDVEYEVSRGAGRGGVEGVRHRQSITQAGRADT